MIVNAMKPFVVLIILLFPFMSQAKPLCPQSNTTVEMNQCLNYKLELAVKTLKNNLDLIHIRYTNNKAMLKTIDDSQAAWEAFRKKQCQSVFLLWDDGSAQSLMTVSCSIQLARERNQFLRDTYLAPR